MTDPTTPRRTPVDPWGHESGEDVNHLLGPWGHARHQAEPLAHLIGEPEVIRPPRPVDPKIVLGVLAVAIAAAAAAVVVALDLL